MNTIGILDLLASVGSVTAFVLVFSLGSRRLPPNIWKLLLFLLSLGAVHDLSNYIEWTGVSELPDTMEDFLEAMWSLLWPLVFVAFLNAKTDRDLKESEERYRTLVEKSHAGISVVQDGRLAFVSRRLAEIMGRTVEEMMGRSPLEFLHPEDVRTMEQNMVARSQGMPAEDRYTVRAIRSDGSVRHLDIIGSLINWYGAPASLGNVVDVTDRSMAEQALQESERRFRTMFDASPEAIAMSRMKDGFMTDINESFLSTFGYRREEVVGSTSIGMGLWDDPSERPRYIALIEDEGFAESFETLFRRSDGSPVPVLLSGRIIELEGEPRLLSVVRDVSRLKQAEQAVRGSLAEKETLLREIHHRVKNNLQVISGLLNLQARHIDDGVSREIYKESQNRVITMALIHEKLYQSGDLAKVDFGDYVGHLARNLLISYGAGDGKVGFVLDAQPVSIVVDTAIPCGLIVNELITNAVKHAFPDGRKGKIRVGFRRLDGEDTFELIVCDNGVGLPEGLDVEEAPSLGLKLVRLLVEQLGGNLEMRSDGGTCFRIRFKEYHEAGTEFV